MLKQIQNNTDINNRLPPYNRRCDMDTSDNSSQSGQFRDRRARYRLKEMTKPMAVIRSSTGPVYLLKVRELSDQGVGIVVRPDSQFLQMIEVGQEVTVRLVLPKSYSFRGSSGHLRSRVVHITEILEGRFKGHMIVGLSFLIGTNSG